MPSCCPWYQVQQALKVAVVSKRQVLDLPFFDFSPSVSTIGLQDGRFRTDRRGFGRSAGLERKIDADVAVHYDIHGVPNSSPEPLVVNGNLVVARRQMGKFIVPAFVRGGAAPKTGIYLCDRNSRAYYNGAARITYRPKQRGIHRLPLQPSATHK